jgi:hypothetical protein
VDKTREGLGWEVNIYLDACHSGSIIKEGTAWVNKQKPVENSDKYHSDAKVASIALAFF